MCDSSAYCVVFRPVSAKWASQWLETSRVTWRSLKLVQPLGEMGSAWAVLAAADVFVAVTDAFMGPLTWKPAAVAGMLDSGRL